MDIVMTKKELIDMARKAGGIDLTNTRANVTVWVGTGTSDFLEAFGKLIAEKERKECADMIEDLENIDWNIWDCAKAIRERGKE